MNDEEISDEEIKENIRIDTGIRYYDRNQHIYKPRAIAWREGAVIHLLCWDDTYKTHSLPKKTLCGQRLFEGFGFELGDMDGGCVCKKCLKLMKKMDIKKIKTTEGE